MPGLRQQLHEREEQLQRRRDAWDRGLNHSVWHAQKNEYNALYDIDMRHFFENEKVQAHLFNIGLIDNAGRVLNLEKNRSKLHVIQHEFSQAEKADYWRQKQEVEMRERVQKKRFEALERMKQQERILRMREDCRIRNDIVSAIRRTATASPMSSSRRQSTTRTSSRKSGSNSSSSRRKFSNPAAADAMVPVQMMTRPPSAPAPPSSMQQNDLQIPL